MKSADDHLLNQLGTQGNLQLGIFTEKPVDANGELLQFLLFLGCALLNDDSDSNRVLLKEGVVCVYPWQQQRVRDVALWTHKLSEVVGS